MSYLLAWCVAVSVPAVVTLAGVCVWLARAGASDSVKRAEAEQTLERVGAKLRGSQEQRQRLGVALARYKREIRDLEEYATRTGDPAAIRRHLDDILQAHSDEDDPDHPNDPGDSPLPAGGATDADRGDQDQ